MRKIAVFLCVVATLFSFYGCQKNYIHGVYEVIITASKIHNYSVGNDWRKVYTCDGRTISSGERWTVLLDTTKTVKIDMVITEVDKWADVGYGFLCVVLSDDFETSTTIIVTENKGVYKGNTAQWKITCKELLLKNWSKRKTEYILYHLIKKAPITSSAVGACFNYNQFSVCSLSLRAFKIILAHI